MRLRTFTAPDIHNAMAQIRQALGDDAVIISTTRDPVNNRVTITAAAERDDPMEGMADNDAPEAVNGHATMPGATEEARVFAELKTVLAHHSVPADVVEKLLETGRMINFTPDATFEGVRKTLAKLLEASFSFLPLPLSRTGFRIMLVGPPGVGKTNTIAKAAAAIAMEKKKVVVITTDTKRAGGVEQLQAFTEILNLPLVVADDRTMLRQILDGIPDEARILIDSSGTNPYDSGELKELGEFLGIGNVEPVLTLPAGGDAQEAGHIAKAFAFTGAKRILITRSDISRRYGSILAAAHAGGYAFCNASSSGKVVGDYRAVDADYLSHLLMKYRLEE